MQILLTAFEGKDNSSNIILEAVAGEHLTKLVLPNTFETSAERMRTQIEKQKPDYVIALGRKPRIKKLFIEPAAYRDGCSIASNFDIGMLSSSLSTHKLPFRVAEKASHYLCNHVYYEGLAYIEQKNLNTRMIFVHTPDKENFEDLASIASWLTNFCKELLDLEEEEGALF